MGLFGKKSPAEKTLKELTGGFFFNKEFLQVLDMWGLKVEDGTTIQKNIKNDIKNQNLSSEDIPKKIHHYLKEFATLDLYLTPTDGSYESTRKCPNCKKEYAADLKVCPFCLKEDEVTNTYKFKKNYDITQENTKKCPNCGTIQDIGNSFCINCQYTFDDVKICPECNLSQDKTNKFCINCGYGFNDEPNVNLTEIRKFKFLANQKHNLIKCSRCDSEVLKNGNFCPKCGSDIIIASEKSGDDDISDLEALYNKSVSEKYSPNFKFAYVIFLESYGKRFLKSTEREYKITETDLNSQAIKDGFVSISSPLIAARKSTVADLKEILRQHNLKVSGKKDDLIKRLGDNLTVEELEEIFPEKSYELSDMGRQFIDENDYILFYEENNNLKLAFTPNEFENIFKDNNYSSKEEMCKLIIDKINSKQTHDIYDVESLIVLNKELNNQFNLLDNYLQLFIYSINSNMHYSNQDEMNALYSLLHSLSLDIDDLKNRFHNVYINFNLIELKISERDSFTFLLKLFNGTSIYEIEQEVNQKFFAFD